MDYKKIVEELEIFLKDQIEKYEKKSEEYKNDGIRPDFIDGMLTSDKSSLKYLEDLRRIYA